MPIPTNRYHIPASSCWPVLSSLGLFMVLFGFAWALPGTSEGAMGDMRVMYIGLAMVVVMLSGWFGQVIGERGKHNARVNTSFRMAMAWFIFSEMMCFAVFFGVLVYVRQFSVPWLAGEGNNAMTHALLWKDYIGDWPTNGPGHVGGVFEYMTTDGIPLWNTMILLSSALIVAWAHWGLKKEHRGQLIFGLLLTVSLGIAFVSLQAVEYIRAYHEMGLKLISGIYGSTFFILTGLHGLHVIIGVIMLLVMLVRAIKGHFTINSHFSFEAATWYWYFVNVVWLGLFVFVYGLV